MRPKINPDGQQQSGFTMTLFLALDSQTNFIMIRDASSRMSFFEHLGNLGYSRTSPYHPQSNPTERFNRTLLQMLRALMDKEKEAWREHLPKVIQYIHITVPGTNLLVIRLTFYSMVDTLAFRWISCLVCWRIQTL